MTTPTLNLGPYLLTLYKRRGRILLSGFVVSALALGVNMVIPPKYGASTVILFPTSTGTPTTMIRLSAMVDPLDIFEGVVNSRVVEQKIADRFKIPRKQAGKSIESLINKPGQQVKITVTADSEKRALEMNRYLVQVLRDVARSGSSDVSAQRAKFLEKELSSRKTQLDQAEQRLVTYQVTASIAPDSSDPIASAYYLRQIQEVKMELRTVEQELESSKDLARQQATSVIGLDSVSPAVGATNRELMLAEAELAKAQVTDGPESPRVVRLKNERQIAQQAMAEAVQKYISAINSSLPPEIARLEARRQVLQSQARHFDELIKVAPQQQLKILAMGREITTLAAATRILQEQYELARVGAAVGDLPWSVLVEPYVEDTPVNKSPVKNAILGFIVGVMLLSIWEIMKVSRAQLRKALESAEHNG